MLDEIPNEQWVVCFVKNGKKRFRRFYAAGYYNAYDKVLTYAEKMQLDILWFKEKRFCNINARELEASCIYCNRMFEESISIQCHCNAILCSRECYYAHIKFKHRDHFNNNGFSNVMAES